MPQNGAQNGTLESGEQAKPNSDQNPTEFDPCLDETESKPKKRPNYFEPYIAWTQDRTGLSRKGVFAVGGLGIFALLLVIVVIALAAAWPRIPHRSKHPVCTEAPCLRASSQIAENLNRSISPCSDLWGAVCGGWVKNHTRPADQSVWNQKQQLVKKELERIRDLIGTLPLPVHTRTIEWNLKYFYAACLDTDGINLDDSRPLTSIITELGGWYILKDWNYQEFDGTTLLIRLHQRYGVTPYFKIHVEPNPHVPGTSSIRISPDGLGLPDKEYYYRDENDRIQAAYKEYIRDVVLYLSSTRSDATKFGNDIFSYEKRIAEVTPDLTSLRNPITTYNAITLSELKLTNLIPFYDILQAMYPSAGITENTEVIVTSLEYLTQISQIIASTDRRTMNGYAMWTLVRHYIPFLSEKYTSAVDTFKSELYGISKPPQRWELCTQLVRKHLPLAFEYLFEKNKPISRQAIQTVNQTFNNILQVVRQRIQKFDNNILLYQQLKSKLDSLSLQVGLPESVKVGSFVADYYNPFTIIKLQLFETIKNSVDFQWKLEQKMLLNQLSEFSVLKLLFEDVPKVAYSEPDNMIVVPRSLVMDPYFESDFPRPIIYGRLGVEIAEAILSSVLPYGSMWTAEKKILSPFHMTVNESFKSVLPSVHCLATYILDLNIDVPSDRANETGLTTLKQLTAVSVAHEALLKASDAKPHIHQPGLEEYEDASLFFLAYAQSQCSDSSTQHQLYENTLQFMLPQRSVLHLAWAQLQQFPEAFECSPNKKLQCRDIF